MARDSTDASRRKHHRSNSDEDIEEPAKRRKHRHHHHRSKHRHHRGKKDEDKQIEDEIENENEEVHNKNSDAEVDLAEPSANLGTVAVMRGSNLGIDYEMEEGEIIEEEAFVSKRGGDGDLDPGEIANLSGGIDEFSTGVQVIGVESSGRNLTDFGGDNVNRKESKKGGSKIHDKVNSANKSSTEHLVKDESVENGLPDESGRKKCHYSDESYLDGKTQSLSSENAEERQKAVGHHSSHGKHRKGGYSRSRSKSPYLSRERSRSRSVLKESSLLGTPRKQDDEYYAERKHKSNSADERMSADSKDYQHGSRDLSRVRERERSSSLHMGRVDRHHSQETRERDRAGSRDIERERIREKEKERERDRRRERERERQREIDMERERVKQRGRERDREHDREREREREKERRRQRDRWGSRGRSRDIDGDRGSRLRKYGDDDDRDRYNESRQKGYDETSYRERIGRGDRKNVQSPKHSHSADSKKLMRDEDEQEDYEERIGLQLAEQEEEDDLDRIKEESRRRRQAILEKYRSQQSQQKQAHGENNAAKDQAEYPSEPAATVNVFSEIPDGQTESADVYVAEPSFAIGKSPPQNGLTVLEGASGTGGLGEGTPKSERSTGNDIFGESPAGVRKKSERSTDMFCDDIFGESPAGVRKKGKGDSLAIERSGLHDNWDDAEGYYSYRFGEMLDGRYEIVAAHGKGVFSSVVRAKDLKAKPGDPEEVAIKMIRNNETMYKAGMTELVILKKLVGADPEDRRHCVRFISSFKYRNHLCLVFESLHMNLREVLKKFGRNIGLKLTAVRAYAKQLFIALKHLKNCGVLHCDIKPDNMLVNEAKNVLKLCDFGNAMFAGKNEITPYLVSRFYRAPEIILGLPYDHPMDMWSVGCCLFELYTGKVLFPGATNNDMLRLHMELKGPFPKKMLRKGAFTDQHFDQDVNFLATEEDPVTKRAIKRLLLNIKPKDIGVLVSGSSGEDPKMLANFKDLLEKIFVLDPDKRLTVSQALSHPFITGK